MSTDTRLTPVGRSDESITGKRATTAKHGNACRFMAAQLVPLVRDLDADARLLEHPIKLWERQGELRAEAKQIATASARDYDDAIEALALGHGKLDAAVDAAIDTATNVSDTSAAKQALADAAEVAAAMAYQELSAHRVSIIGAVNRALAARIADAAEALERIPDGVTTADEAVQVSTEVAADWAILAGASTLWRRSIDVVGGLERYLGKNVVARSSLALYVRFAHPEFLTRATVGLPDPLKVAAAAKAGCQPGVYDIDAARENFARVNTLITEVGLPEGSAIERIEGRDDHLRPSTEL